MTFTKDTTAKRKPGKPGRPRKTQATPEASPEPENPFSAQLKASRESYDSTKGSARNPKPGPLTLLQGGLASNPEPKASKATRAWTSSSSNATNGSAGTTLDAKLAVAVDGKTLGTQTLPTFPPFRVRGNVASATNYVKSLAPELLEQWAANFIATGKRQDWLFKVAPHFGRENNRYRADIVREIETQQVTQQELMRLKAEEVMSDLDRRRLLKSIAHAPEHEMKGWADNLKAIELDARHDPESCMSKGSNSQAPAALPAVNLFFLPASAARPMQLLEQQAKPIDC